jgi:heme-degrading monooxygenase HmoA
MHAVVVKVSIQAQDEEPSLKYLRENIVPRVSQAPGFVAGYWVRLEGGDEGNSVVVFESEEAARAAAEQVRAGVRSNEGVTLEDLSLGEVVANA